MITYRLVLSCVALLSFISTVKVDVAKKKHIKGNTTEAEGSGFKRNSTIYNEEASARNRSRKDYIIAIEDSAPVRRDPVFSMLKRLAKRTRGQMAVLDYSNANKRFTGPLLSRLGLRNPFINNDERNYDEDDNDDNDDEDDYNLRLGGRQSLVGRNVINSFLGLQNFPYEEERPRPRDDVRRVEDEALEDRNSDFAPPVVYEMEGENRGDYDDDVEENEDDEDDNGYTRGLPGRAPMFLFGNDD